MRLHNACVVCTTLVLAVTIGPAPVARADPPAAGTLVATLPAPAAREVKSGFGSIWVSNGPARTVTRIDPRTYAVLAVIPVPDPASVLAIGAGAVWLTSFPGNSLTRIDPATNTVTGIVSLAPRGAGAIGVTVFRGFVWVVNHDGEPTSSVAKIDPRTMAIVDVIPTGDEPDAGAQIIDAGAGSLWAEVANLEAVVRIDPKADAVTATIPVAGDCGPLAAGRRAVWVACTPGIYRIDPATDAVSGLIDTGAEENRVAADGHAVWFGTVSPDGVGRIDANTNRIVSTLALPGPPFGMTVAFGRLWITDRDNERLYVVEPTWRKPSGRGCERAWRAAATTS